MAELRGFNERGRSRFATNVDPQETISPDLVGGELCISTGEIRLEVDNSILFDFLNSWINNASLPEMFRTFPANIIFRILLTGLLFLLLDALPGYKTKA
jgi:hypothetical protein